MQLLREQERKEGSEVRQEVGQVVLLHVQHQKEEMDEMDEDRKMEGQDEQHPEAL